MSCACQLLGPAPACILVEKEEEPVDAGGQCDAREALGAKRRPARDAAQEGGGERCFDPFRNTELPVHGRAEPDGAPAEASQRASRDRSAGSVGAKEGSMDGDQPARIANRGEQGGLEHRRGPAPVGRACLVA